MKRGASVAFEIVTEGLNLKEQLVLEHTTGIISSCMRQQMTTPNLAEKSVRALCCHQNGTLVSMETNNSRPVLDRSGNGVAAVNILHACEYTRMQRKQSKKDISRHTHAQQD